MGTTTMGVKLDEATRERLKSAAGKLNRTPHWLIKQAIFTYLERVENHVELPELGAGDAADELDNSSLNAGQNAA
ncbi:MAG: ribbon-helix-helix protein, CopG family, partial [Plesiomonas shigelloides]